LKDPSHKGKTLFRPFSGWERNPLSSIKYYPGEPEVSGALEGDLPYIKGLSPVRRFRQNGGYEDSVKRKERPTMESL
jgi:hypothetical protein